MTARSARRLTTLLLGVGIGFGAATVVPAYEAARSSRSEKSAAKAAAASAESAAVESKLDAILANQEKILQRFDAVMEELRIIKVRASLQ